MLHLYFSYTTIGKQRCCKLSKLFSFREILSLLIAVKKSYIYNASFDHFVNGFAKDATMNILTHIKDGDTTLRISGTFGQDKTVTINQFGGVTYLHFRRPNGYGEDGKKIP